MSERLDELVAGLAESPTDRSLDGLEWEIGRGIQARRRDARVARILSPVRAASIGLALAMGMAAGGLTAAGAMAGPRLPAVLSGGADLAPSTLLEGRP